MPDASTTLPVDQLHLNGPPTSAPATTLKGLHTCLPRLRRDGESSKLVSDERPRFETTGLLGRGGLGEVVAAQDLDIGRKVAIKRIRPDRASQSAFLRFVQEVRTVGSLDHPNIVPVHDVSRDEQGQFYFVMKHVEGQTLAALLTQLRAGDVDTHREYTFERRLSTFVQICHAVEFAHSRGVLHRDLKPENVMVGTHGEVTLLDWGVAKQIGQPDAVDEEHTEADANVSLSVTQTRVGQLIGTPRYMAPEQARGGEVDERTDVYGLCLLLYEMLGLANPLEHLDHLDEVLNAARDPKTPDLVVSKPRPIQGRVPADMAWIAMDGLHVAPEKRYPSVATLLARIERRAEGHIDVQCPMTMQLSLWQRGLGLARRRPLFLMASIAVVASVLFVGVLGIGIAVGAVFGGTLGALLI